MTQFLLKYPDDKDAIAFYREYMGPGDFWQEFAFRISPDQRFGPSKTNQDLGEWMYTGDKLTSHWAELSVGNPVVPPVRADVYLHRSGHPGCTDGHWVLSVKFRSNPSRREYIFRKSLTGKASGRSSL